MTYLAPRQGLFAIIILISFLIHTTLLLISTDQQLDELKMQTGERMLVQLIEEVKLPLLSKDKVSLSVLTGRYTSENHVASLTIKDIDGNELLQTGQAQLLQGDVISRDVILNDDVIGEVLLTLRDTSKGEIIASQWLFVLGSFIAHFLIWLLYGYIARPTKQQLAALSRDVQDHLITHQRIDVKRTRRTDGDALADTDSADEIDDKPSTSFNVNKAVNRYIQSHKNEEGEPSNQNSTTSEAFDAEVDTDDFGAKVTAKKRFRDHFVRSSEKDARFVSDDSLNEDDANANTSHQAQAAARSKNTVSGNSTLIKGNKTAKSHLLATRPIDTAVVQIEFSDPYNLIGTLAPEQASPYFMLCTQLMQRTLDEILKQPLLYGITVSKVSDFDAAGATVEFKADNSHNKAALAAMMFAKVYMMLHEITCVKLRELGRFAADIYIGASDAAVAEPMHNLLQNNGEANEIYALLPTAGIKQVSGHMQLNSLSKPRTVYERDCVYLDGMNDAMMQRLVDVRNTVLLSGQ